ncbi:hypothetical protein Tco_0545020 [Tanacetum coccineum]
MVSAIASASSSSEYSWSESRLKLGDLNSSRLRVLKCLLDDRNSHSGLEVGSIQRIPVLDTAYWGFLRLGTTLDIFQNIHILFLEYSVLSFSGYGVLSFNPMWSLVSAGTDTPPNQAFQFLDDKVLFKLDWSTKSQNEHHQKSIDFTNGSDSNRDNALLMEKLEALTLKMESQFQSLKEEMHEMHKNYNNRGGNQASKNDDTPMCERHEANYIQSEDFKRCVRSMITVHSKLYERDGQSKTDLEKTITKFLDGQRVANMYVKKDVNDMIIKMKQNETKIKNMERKLDEWSKSQNVSSEQTDRADPPPPQAQTEQVNVVFTESGKSDDSPKIQKDLPPPMIVNNKTEKDRPSITSKKGYHVVETKEYPFREYIPKIPYPQALKVDHPHLNRIMKES